MVYSTIRTGDKNMSAIHKRSNLVITYKNNPESRSELIKFLIDFLINEKVKEGEEDVRQRKKL